MRIAASGLLLWGIGSSGCELLKVGVNCSFVPEAAAVRLKPKALGKFAGSLQTREMHAAVFDVLPEFQIGVIKRCHWRAPYAKTYPRASF